MLTLTYIGEDCEIKTEMTHGIAVEREKGRGREGERGRGAWNMYFLGAVRGTFTCK